MGRQFVLNMRPPDDELPFLKHTLSDLSEKPAMAGAQCLPYPKANRFAPSHSQFGKRS